MSSALDTLLEAARYIELQEQQNSTLGVSLTPIGSSYNRHYYNDIMNSKISHENNNQQSSPAISPSFNISKAYPTSSSIPIPRRSPDVRIEENTSVFDEKAKNLYSPNNESFNFTRNFCYTNPTNNNRKLKFVPLTPPPISSKKFVETSRIRSISLSSNKITANGNNGTQNQNGALSIFGNSFTLSATTEDSSQSSLNLSSSGYLSGSSINSSIGSNSNLLTTNDGTSTAVFLNNGENQLQGLSTNRKRTTSTNSNSGTQRSPCMQRAGTREVHNKLEKHRRAHLKECFEQLKVQLQLKDEEKKKTSNLAILGAAYRHVKALRIKERELEQQVEQLAKEKINAQKKIVALKRELSAKFDNIDFSAIIGEGESASDRDTNSLSSGRASHRYNSSSSISSIGNNRSSPLGVGMSVQLSPVIPLNSSSLMNLKAIRSLPGITSRITNTSTSCQQNESSIQTISAAPSCNIIPTLMSSSNDINPASIKIIPNCNKNITSSSINSNNNTPATKNICVTFAKKLTDNKSMIQKNRSNSNSNVSHDENSSGEDMIGKTNICRPSYSDCSDSSLSTNISLNDSNKSDCDIATISNNFGLVKEFSNVNEIIDDNKEHPTKVIKLFNGIALPPTENDIKKIITTPMSLSQVVTGNSLVVPMLSSPGLRVVGTNGVATIEFSSPSSQSQQSGSFHQNQPIASVSSTNGNQLRKLLINSNGLITPTTGISATRNNPKPIFTNANTDSRLPGIAELNILANNSSIVSNQTNIGKTPFISTNISLKGSDINNPTVHVVVPTGNSSISNLAPIVVSQCQSGSNYTHALFSTQPLTGKVNLSVNGQPLPILSTQYLSSIKPLVVVSNGSSSLPNGNLNILPQNEHDVSTRLNSGHKLKNHRSRKFIFFCLVLLVIITIIGIVIAPFLVSTTSFKESNWFIKTKSVVNILSRSQAETDQKNRQKSDIKISSTNEGITITSVTDASINADLITTEQFFEKSEMYSTHNNIKPSTSEQKSDEMINSNTNSKKSILKNPEYNDGNDGFENYNDLVDNIKDTKEVKITNNVTIASVNSFFKVTTAFPLTAHETVKVNLKNKTAQSIQKKLRRIETKSGPSKKPIILPVLAKTNSIQTGSNQSSNMSVGSNKINWMSTRWPKIDVSTYFHWTDYKSGNSVILPGILGIVIIAVISVVVFSIISRNKRKIVTSLRKRNRSENDIEQSREDNTNLLTTSNLSDEE